MNVMNKKMDFAIIARKTPTANYEKMEITNVMSVE